MIVTRISLRICLAAAIVFQASSIAVAATDHDAACTYHCTPLFAHSITGSVPAGAHYLVGGHPTTEDGRSKPETPCTNCSGEECTYGTFTFEFDGGTGHVVSICRPAGCTLTDHQNSRPGILRADCNTPVGTDFVQFQVIDTIPVPPQVVYTEYFGLGCGC